jgi:hypothetical protein
MFDDSLMFAVLQSHTLVVYRVEWGEERRLGCLRIGCWGNIGPKRDEGTGEWRELNVELNDLYYYPILFG